MSTTAKPEGLTTTKAPFIEKAQDNGELYIEQPYELYSEENHDTWRRLYKTILPKWDKYANDRFMGGVESLGLKPDAIPRLDEINREQAQALLQKGVIAGGMIPKVEEALSVLGRGVSLIAVSSAADPAAFSSVIGRDVHSGTRIIER